MKTWMKYQDIVEHCAELARSEVSRLACSGIVENRPLLFKAGELRVVRPHEKGEFMAAGFSDSGRVLTCDIPYSHYYQWIKQNSYDLGIL